MFGYPSQSSWRAATRGLTSFRDQVMHPTSEFLGRRTISDLIEMETKLRSMLLTVGGP